MERICRILNKDEKVEEMEKIRREAFEIQQKEPSPYYRNKIKNSSLIRIACLEEDNILGGAYITNSYHSLYIDELFVKKEVQKQGIGSFILEFILENKEKLEEIFQTKFEYSLLESKEQDSFYEKNGFKKDRNGLEMHRKKI